MTVDEFENGFESMKAITGDQVPYDEKIIGGIALKPGSLEPKILFEITEKLASLFDSHGVDYSGEAGDCITYGIGLGEGEMYVIEEILLHTAARRNHGMKELSRSNIASDVSRLWLGQTATRRFTLHRHNGPIALRDDTYPIGNVYSLHSKPIN